MTLLETFQASLLGGWEPKGCDFEMIDIGDRAVCKLTGEEDEGYYGIYDLEYPEEGWWYSFLPEAAVFDPNFWKHLGKNLKWVGKYMCPCCGACKVDGYKGIEGWKYYQYKFIEHTNKGGTFESFFLQF